MSECEKVALEYKSSLEDLKINSKPRINMLTMVAEENLPYAAAIVNVIERHIKEVDVTCMLPALYLIDSVIKNIGGDYLALFSKNIVAIFCHIFSKVDEPIRAQLYKLRQTWAGLINNKKLFELDNEIKKMDPAWPVTASPPTPGIHVNPKFLEKSPIQDSPISTQVVKETGQSPDVNEIKKKDVPIQKPSQKQANNVPRPSPADPRLMRREKQAGQTNDPLILDNQSKARMIVNQQVQEKIKLLKEKALQKEIDTKDIAEEKVKLNVTKSEKHAPIAKSHPSKSSSRHNNSSSKLKNSNNQENISEQNKSETKKNRTNKGQHKEVHSIKETTLRNDEAEVKTEKLADIKDNNNNKKSDVDLRLLAQKEEPLKSLSSPRKKIKPSTPDDLFGDTDKDYRPGSQDWAQYKADHPEKISPDAEDTNDQPLLPMVSPPPQQQEDSKDSTSTITSGLKAELMMKKQEEILRDIQEKFNHGDITKEYYEELKGQIKRLNSTDEIQPLEFVEPKADAASYIKFYDTWYELHTFKEKIYIPYDGHFREIYFNGTANKIIIDDKEFMLNFGEAKTFSVDGIKHQFKFGFPSRELFINDVPYEIKFGDPPKHIKLGNNIHTIQVCGPPPPVELGSEIISPSINFQPMPLGGPPRLHTQDVDMRQMLAPEPKGDVDLRPKYPIKPEIVRDMDSRSQSPPRPKVEDFRYEQPPYRSGPDFKPFKESREGHWDTWRQEWGQDDTWQKGDVNPPRHHILPSDNQPPPYVPPRRIEPRPPFPQRHPHEPQHMNKMPHFNENQQFRPWNTDVGPRTRAPFIPMGPEPGNLPFNKFNQRPNIPPVQNRMPNSQHSAPQTGPLIRPLPPSIPQQQPQPPSQQPFQMPPRNFGPSIQQPSIQQRPQQFNIAPPSNPPPPLPINNQTIPPPALQPPFPHLPPQVETTSFAQSFNPTRPLLPPPSAPSVSYPEQNDVPKPQPPLIGPTPPVAQPFPNVKQEKQPLLATPPTLPVDINTLYDKLVHFGIISKLAPAPEANVEKEKVEKEEKPLPIQLDSNTLRAKRQDFIDNLYFGNQCSSCGQRFSSKQMSRYGDHLDWHFRSNRREKNSLKKAFSRKWYYDKGEWCKYMEYEDPEERQPSFFEEQQEADKSPEPIQLPTVLAPVEETQNTCSTCGERFDVIWQEELEEWHLSNALKEDDMYFHPFCLEDYKKYLLSLEEEKRKKEEEGEEEALKAEEHVPCGEEPSEPLPKEEPMETEQQPQIKEEAPPDKDGNNDVKTEELQIPEDEQMPLVPPIEEEYVFDTVVADEVVEEASEEDMVVMGSGGLVLKVKAESIIKPTASATTTDNAPTIEEEEEVEFEPPPPDPRFTQVDPVTRGAELTGLCSVM